MPCSLCKRYGHNKKTCPVPVIQEPKINHLQNYYLQTRNFSSLFPITSILIKDMRNMPFCIFK